MNHTWTTNRILDGLRRGVINKPFAVAMLQWHADRIAGTIGADYHTSTENRGWLREVGYLHSQIRELAR